MDCAGINLKEIPLTKIIFSKFSAVFRCDPDGAFNNIKRFTANLMIMPSPGHAGFGYQNIYLRISAAYKLCEASALIGMNKFGGQDF